MEKKVTSKKLTTQTRPTYAEAFDSKVLAQYPVEAQVALLELIQSAESKNTKKATAQAVRHYVEVWNGPLPCTPTDLSFYLNEYARRPSDEESPENAVLDKRRNKNLKGFSIATLEQRRSLFGSWHKRTFGDNPNNSDAVRATMRSIRVSCGEPQEQANALPMRILKNAEEKLRRNRQIALEHDDRQSMLKFSRNRALLLTAFWFGLRASELVNLRIKDVEMFWDEDPPWMRVTIRRSKTDREGRGQKKLFEAYPTKHLCPIYAIRQWKEDRFQGVSDERSTDGLLPLFSKVDRWGNVWTKNINANSMNTLIEKLFTVDTQAAHDRYTSHSMRRGLANWMDQEDGNQKDIMEWIGWRDPRTALRYLDARHSSPTSLTKAKLAKGRKDESDNS